MNMNENDVKLAVQTGIQLLSPASGINVPVGMLDGSFMLKQLLLAINVGQLMIAPAAPIAPDGNAVPPAPPLPPELVKDPLKGQVGKGA